MRELNLIEVQAVSGAEGPPIVAAAAGAVISTVGYLGMQAGSGQPLSWKGGATAATSVAVAGAFVPIRMAQAAGSALGAFYGGLGGGYVQRDGGGDGGR
jgi:hypothetical protein